MIRILKVEQITQELNYSEASVCLLRSLNRSLLRSMTETPTVVQEVAKRSRGNIVNIKNYFKRSR